MAVHKANIMKKADGLFLECVREVGRAPRCAAPRPSCCPPPALGAWGAARGARSSIHGARGTWMGCAVKCKARATPHAHGL